MLKKILTMFIFAMINIGLLNASEIEETQELDINQKEIETLRIFDNPFLLGAWSNEKKISNNLYMLKFFLVSDYSYSMLFYKNSSLIEYDIGYYKKVEDELILNSINGSSKTYKIMNTNHLMMIDEMLFTKMLLPSMVGQWSSISQSNNLNLKIKELILSEKYTFSVIFEGVDGSVKKENRLLCVRKRQDNIFL